MSIIRGVIGLGAVFYALLSLIQFFQHSAVIYESILITLVLAVLAALPYTLDVKTLKKYEMYCVWFVVLLFAVYGLLFAGGFI